ncbi:ester cyclase [Streptomyces sp. NPDC087420]|uniref:ester cyclase n=1 Tax=Streptomyces sp. NPDC087420 TaxID=3365785 RepID=UPI003835A4DE
MSTQENQAEPAEIVHRFIEECVNGGDLDVVDDLWAEDMIWRGGSLGEIHGRAPYKEMLAANVGRAFTGMHLEILRTVTDGDTVVLLFTNSGTHEGEFLGVPATGGSARWHGVGFYRVSEGRIAEALFVEDILDALVQLGAIDLAPRG